MTLITYGGVVAALAAAAWADSRRRRIPHWPAAGLAAGWVVAAITAPGLLGDPAFAGLACATVALVVGAALWRMGWVGAGDAKLAALLGLWLGPLDFGLALLAGGVLALILAGPAFAISGEMARRGVPLACALAPPAAVLFVWRAAELLAVPSDAWPVG